MKPDACNPFHAADPGFRRLRIFGAGGFAREVAWLAEQAWGDRISTSFVVDRPEFVGEPVNGLRIELLSELSPDNDARFIVAIGDPARRAAAVDVCIGSGMTPTRIIHPRAEMSRWVDIGDGVVICAGNIVTTNVNLGKHVHVNLGCTIGHQASIGDFTTLSPGVHVSGNVRIGRGVFVGTGATIINGTASEPLSIGDGAIVAAGACVTKPVESGALVAGVPAVRKR
ncbi:acetyltransferase [Lysobacter sp. TAF61]|uniref:acetyltransferase n=1 Tax=Lysobacter sp. TAF61 TaxID=3233072 RepID=UPI003F9DD8DD